jgi:hypothetical protein
MRKSSGCPTTPITANVVGMTPATTMSGPVAASTESSRPAVPRRPARRALSCPLKVLIPASVAGGGAVSLVLELPVVMAGLSLPCG